MLDRIDWRLYAQMEQRQSIFEWEQYWWDRQQLATERLQWGLGTHPLQEGSPYLWNIWNTQHLQMQHRQQIHEAEHAFFSWNFSHIRAALGVTEESAGYVWDIRQTLSEIMGWLQQLSDFAEPGEPTVEPFEPAETEFNEYQEGTVRNRIASRVLETEFPGIPSSWFGTAKQTAPKWEIPVNAGRYSMTLDVDWSFWSPFRVLASVPIMFAAVAWGLAQIWEELRRYG